MQPRSRPWAGRLRGIFLRLLPVLLVTVAWRAPSLFDPPWVNDEGTYFAVAQAMSHGYRLYARIWENKPPGLYLLFEAIYRQYGVSLIAVRVAALIAVAVSTTCAFLIGRYLLSEAAGAGAALFVGLFFGTPFLEGTTANAEVFTAALCALGVYLWLVRGWPLAAGVAVALAILFKSVAAFDAAAIGLWLLVHDRSSFLRFAASLIVVLGIAMGVAAMIGVFGAMIHDAFLYDIGYVGHANGGMVPWVLYTKLAVLVVLTIWCLRARFAYLWLVYSVAGALLSGRIFGHYFLQAGVPFALAMFVALRLDRFPRGAIVGLLGATAIIVSTCTAAGWAMAVTGKSSILSTRLQYYKNFATYAVGLESYGTYRAQVDDHVTRNLRIVHRLKRLPRGKLLVWGNTPWIYPLSRRLPVTMYTSARRHPTVPGETSRLRRAVTSGRAHIVVVIYPADPPLGQAARALHRRYHRAGTVGNATIYVR